jgi:hypothetical protein
MDPGKGIHRSISMGCFCRLVDPQRIAICNINWGETIEEYFVGYERASAAE